MRTPFAHHENCPRGGNAFDRLHFGQHQVGEVLQIPREDFEEDVLLAGDDIADVDSLNGREPLAKLFGRSVLGKSEH